MNVQHARFQKVGTEGCPKETGWSGGTALPSAEEEPRQVQNKQGFGNAFAVSDWLPHSCKSRSLPESCHPRSVRRRGKHKECTRFNERYTWYIPLVMGPRVPGCPSQCDFAISPPYTWPSRMISDAAHKAKDCPPQGSQGRRARKGTDIRSCMDQRTNTLSQQ